MAGPWEKYQAAPAPAQDAGVQPSGPWAKYQQQAPAQQPQEAPQGASEFEPLIMQAAQKYQLDPRLVRAVVKQESSFNPRAISPKGAAGLMQLMPGTAAELGVSDPMDPAQNIEGGAKYLRQLSDRYKGNVNAVLAAYNWGMGNLDKRGLKNMPAETRNYLEKVRGYMGDPDVPYPGVAPDNPYEPTTPDIDQDLAKLNREAIEKPLTRAEYDTRRAALAQDYFKRTGKRPEHAGLEDFARGLGTGLLQDPVAAVQQVTAGLIPDVVERAAPGGQTTNERIAAEEKAREQYRTATGEGGMDVGRLVGNIVNPASLATGGAGAAPAWAARMAPRAQQAVSAAIRGGAGAAMTPVDPEAAGGVAGQKALQVGIGAAAGPAAEALGTGVKNVAGRTAGAIADKMASEEVESLVNLSRQWGVDLLAGDYDTNRRLVRGIEGRLINSQVPGLNIDLERQQKQAMAAAEKMVGIQNKQLQSMTFASMDKIRQIAAGNTKRAAEAKAVLKMADEAGTDARKIMQASGNLKWLRMKLSSDELYDEVERLAGKADVNPSKTIGALDQAMRKAERVVDVDRGTLQLIEQWKNRLDMDPAEAGPNTYMRMREFLSDVQSRVEQATTNGTTSSGALWLKDISKAIRADMDAFTTSKPNLKAANERANAFYQERVVPFQQATLAKALKSDNPDDVYAAFVRSGAEWKGEHAQQVLYKALDEKGKAAVRAGVLQDAFAQATSPEYFSPTGFNKVLRGTGYESFFTGPARTELEGLMHIVDRVSRSDPKRLATFTPMIGNMLGANMAAGTTAVLGGAPAALGTAAAGLAATGAMKWLVTSEAGRKLLYSANLYKPGSKHYDQRMGEILDNINRQFAATTAKAAGMESGREGSVLP